MTDPAAARQAVLEAQEEAIQMFDRWLTAAENGETVNFADEAGVAEKIAAAEAAVNAVDTAEE